MILQGMQRRVYSAMGMMELLLTAVALSMDALAVSITNGLTIRKLSWRHALKTGLFFGFFQALMPVIGYLAGVTIRDVIVSIDHWVTFGLLAAIGGKMAWDALHEKDDGAQVEDPTHTATLTLMAIATSIDALAVGIGLALNQVNIFASSACIGLVTFVLCVCGVMLGKKLGDAFQKHAQVAGGVVLILIGLKILVEHLMQGV